MLGFHSSKSWNIPHELPNSLFYDVGMMGEPTRQEGSEHAHVEVKSSTVELVEARMGGQEDRRPSGSKSAPNTPRTAPGDHPFTNNQAKINTLSQQGPVKRKKRLPDYVTFSRGPSKHMSTSSMSVNEVEPEKKKEWLDRKLSHGKDSPEAALLRRKLSDYSIYGLPRLSRDIRLFWEIREGNETSIRLENSWRDIVNGHENMSRKYTHQQEAVWELLCTELSYMKKLRIITDLVICTLINLHDCSFLNEIQPEYLFSNIPHIIRAHRCFWQEVFSPVLEQARQSRQPIDPMSLYEGFHTFPRRFEAYIHYCLEVKKKMEFARVQYKDNELFRVFVSWVEKHKQSHRLRLGDMLMRPHQRITKYSLLLKAIMKRTEHPITKEALNSMASSVERFLHHINTQMQRGEDYDKLRATMDRIGTYDVLEPGSEEIEKNLKAFSHLDLTCPILGVTPHNIRQLLKEGPLKMKDGKEAKAEVHGFLFTDAFIITKMHRKTELAKVIRSPLMLDKVICRPLRDPSTFLLIYLNEFHCVAQALSFQCASADACKDWRNKIIKTQNSLQILKDEEARRQEQERQILCLASDSQNDLTISDSRSLSLWSDESRSQSEFSIVVPRLVITDDDHTQEKDVSAEHLRSLRMTDNVSCADEHSEISDAGYGTLLPSGDEATHRGLRRQRSKTTEDIRLTVSTSDLRQRHNSEPFDRVEASAAYSGPSPLVNQALRRSMPQLAHVEKTPITDPTLKVEETGPGSLQKIHVSTPRIFLRVPVNPEDESYESGLLDRSVARPTRGPSLVMETLRRAKYRDRNWRLSLADSVDLYSDSQSDISDVEELESEPNRSEADPDQDGEEKRIPVTHKLSKDSVEEQEEHGHPRTIEIQFTGDESNPSELANTEPSVDTGESLVLENEVEPSPNGVVFTFEQSDIQDFQDSYHVEQYLPDSSDNADTPAPWLLSPEGFLIDSDYYDSPRSTMPPLLTPDIFLEIINDANHQRRRLTKAELRRIRSIKIDSTTTVSEV